MKFITKIEFLFQITLLSICICSSLSLYRNKKHSWISKRLLSIANAISKKISKQTICTEEPIVCPEGYMLTQAEVVKVTANGCGPSNFPWVAKAILDNAFPFKPCCNDHDLCYGGKESENKYYYKLSRKQCDVSFKKCMIIKAKEAKNNNFLEDAASIIYHAVNEFGCSAFKNARITSHCKKI